jgi:Disulphide bond corrector protein DsbC
MPIKLRIQEFFNNPPCATRVYTIFVVMKIIGIFVLFIFSAFSNAQSEITWNGTFDMEKNTALITANLGEGWHLYAMEVDEMKGPVSTKIRLAENPSVETRSEIMEPQPIVSYDNNFESELQYFEKTVTFEQELIIKESTELNYTVTFMICNDVMCYPPVDEVIKISVLK